MQTYVGVDHTEQLSQRKCLLITLELAWRYRLPWVNTPSKLFLSNWLNRANSDWSTIIDLFEAASQRDDVHDPEAWVWAQIRRKYPHDAVRRWVVSEIGHA